MIIIWRKCLNIWLQFLCDECLKYFCQRVRGAVALVACCFVNEGDYANAGQTANQNLTLLRNVELIGSQVAGLASGQYRLAKVGQYGRFVARCRFPSGRRLEADGVIHPVEQIIGNKRIKALLGGKLVQSITLLSAGAADRLPVVSVTNLSRSLRELQKLGVWIYGLAGEADATLYSLDLKGNVALVLGGEAEGLRRLTREHCDALVRIPMPGEIESLNVSVAAGVCLFEAVRQRG